MARDVRVRPARTRDLPEIVRLWRELIGYHEALGGQDFRLAAGAEGGWRAYLGGHIGRKTRTCLVAEDEGRLVGFLLAGVERRPGIFMERVHGLISDVYVRPAYRRRGVGRRLVDAALEWFGGRRVSRVRLRTDARNAPGVAFWKRLGFETVALTMDRLLGVARRDGPSTLRVNLEQG